MARTSYIQWGDDDDDDDDNDDDDVCFVLDQNAKLEFYSPSSLKQKSAGRYVAPLGHIILILSQAIFYLSP